MELRHLRCLVAAVEDGSLHAAAKKLAIAQPALSRRIQDLEAIVGCELLVRSVRGVTPTRAGQALYQEALQILDRAADAVELTQRIGLVQGRETRLGIIQTSRKYGFIHEALAAHADSHPEAGVAISRGESHILANDLRQGRLDMTVLYEIHPGASRLGVRLIHKERYVLAMHPGHRLAGSGPVRFDELAGEPFVWLLRRHGPGSRDALLQYCRLNGLEPVIGQLANSPEELIDLVVVSGGMCLTPASTAMAVPTDQLVFRTVPQLGLELDLTLAWNRQLQLQEGKAFLACLNGAIDRHQQAIRAATVDWARRDGLALVRCE